IKLQYGHAFYDTALENETFDVTIIGSDQKETYNQLQISDIIEARLEEIFQLSAKEMMRLGYHDLRGGFVLTGGTMKLPGILELAHAVFQVNPRRAVADDLGVKEPQYTVGVGTIQFAHYNAKTQGKQLEPALMGNETQAKPAKKQKKQPVEEGESKKDK